MALAAFAKTAARCYCLQGLFRECGMLKPTWHRENENLQKECAVWLPKQAWLFDKIPICTLWRRGGSILLTSHWSILILACAFKHKALTPTQHSTSIVHCSWSDLVVHIITYNSVQCSKVREEALPACIFLEPPLCVRLLTRQQSSLGSDLKGNPAHHHGPQRRLRASIACTACPFSGVLLGRLVPGGECTPQL